MRHHSVLKHRNPVERRLSGARIAQWFGTRTWNPGVPGSIPKGRGSIFVNPSIILMIFGFGFGHFLVMLGSLFGHVGVTFWSCRGHAFVVLGMSWDVFGSTVGTFSEGVWEKVRTGSENRDSQKSLEVFVPSRRYVD